MNVNSPDETGTPGPDSPDQEPTDIRQLSANQLAKLGVSQIAYVKPVIMEGAAAFAIHAADGTPMAVAGNRDVADAAIRQHEMVPLSVH
jgi:hypothetical protein